MKNKKIISLTAMSLVMGSTIATASADSIGQRFHDPAAISQDVQTERAALRNGDYESWKAAVESGGNTKILEIVNKGNFARYAQAFQLRENGDMAGAEAIMEELGIKEPERIGGNMARGLGLPPESREDLELAIENADYDAWKTVMEKVENDKLEQYLTEDKFAIIVRAYKLQASGDRAGAMALLDDSDIPEFMLMPGGKRMDGGREEMDALDESKHEALMNAYESGDYGVWKALMEKRGGGKILEIVDADNFAEFAQAKILQSQGKMSEAKAILDGLGFPFQERGERPLDMHAFAAAGAN